MARKLNIIKLIEPDLCLECRFQQVANVTSADGTIKRMIYCKRLDCDNWDRREVEPAMDISFDDAENNHGI